MKIYVVTHKNYIFPDSSAYVPIKVGNATGLLVPHVDDASGDSISQLNPSFCELTALYWIWKNSTDDIVGLVHYRRYFSSKFKRNVLNDKAVLSEQEITDILNSNDIIVAKPRNYYLFSVINHYKKAHNIDDLDMLRESILKRYPEYIKSFDLVMKNTRLSLYNMFIAKREIIERYCEWLFPLLFELELKINYTAYDPYQRRVFGFLAERLFNVWLMYNSQNIRIRYVSVVNIEGENVLYKGLGLLRRQFLNIRG